MAKRMVFVQGDGRCNLVDGDRQGYDLDAAVQAGAKVETVLMTGDGSPMPAEGGYLLYVYESTPQATNGKRKAKSRAAA